MIIKANLANETVECCCEVLECLQSCVLCVFIKQCTHECVGPLLQTWVTNWRLRSIASKGQSSPGWMLEILKHIKQCCLSQRKTGLHVWCLAIHQNFLIDIKLGALSVLTCCDSTRTALLLGRMVRQTWSLCVAAWGSLDSPWQCVMRAVGAY